MKKIVFGITCLNLGGAERVLVDIVNELCYKYEITIFTLYGKGELIDEINKKAKIVSLYDGAVDEISFLKKKWLSIQLVNNSLRNKLYEKYIKGKYDIEIAFLEGPISWLFSCNSDARKICWIHSDIEKIFGDNTRSKMKQKLNEKIYDVYDSIVFVSKDNKDKFISRFSNNDVTKEVIYNYLNKDMVRKKAQEEIGEIDDDSISFVQVSRLVEAKAIDRLIKVHKKLIDDGYKHKIYVVGDGPLKIELDKLIEKNDVKDSFVLLGSRKNPYPYIKKGDYFILTSKYEGFGMVVQEAEMLDKYILITDMAAREAVENYDNSVIVENSEEGLYDGLKDIIINKPVVSKSYIFDNKNILENIIKVIEGDKK